MLSSSDLFAGMIVMSVGTLITFGVTYLIDGSVPAVCVEHTYEQPYQISYTDLNGVTIKSESEGFWYCSKWNK